jgi:hypothetical protein
LWTTSAHRTVVAGKRYTSRWIHVTTHAPRVDAEPPLARAARGRVITVFGGNDLLKRIVP